MYYVALVLVKEGSGKLKENRSFGNDLKGFEEVK